MTDDTANRLAHGKIFINLPVADIEASRSFYSALGWEFNPMFSDGRIASFVISEHLYVMLLHTERFQTAPAAPARCSIALAPRR